MKNFFKKLFNISDDEIEVVAEEQAAEPEAVAEEPAVRKKPPKRRLTKRAKPRSIGGKTTNKGWPLKRSFF